MNRIEEASVSAAWDMASTEYWEKTKDLIDQLLDQHELPARASRSARSRSRFWPRSSAGRCAGMCAIRRSALAIDSFLWAGTPCR
jgi:hypothetical protein